MVFDQFHFSCWDESVSTQSSWKQEQAMIQRAGGRVLTGDDVIKSNEDEAEGPRRENMDVKLVVELKKKMMMMMRRWRRRRRNLKKEK
eukprot:686899-Hanusia_phi.AAC.2